MPLDHFNIAVPQGKLEDIITFLTTSFEPLGLKEIARPVPTVVGFGEKTPYFWLNVADLKEVDSKSHEAVLKSQHIAFTAATTEEVRQVHAAALKAGATCNGPPGIRAYYHPGYYAAFVVNPVLGINFEVICHDDASR
ncbi:hypothetical protein LSUE1_G007097 [Lachnellula suecica]|uniref:VOC domain-containing protein n=1 Tax=Lachnellula suecica TaxID=602035 RepID=A0A8T9BZA9_9HELO|nr:hypothetical protein LSUE1_G007097 [Lachnellula suecica]